jgi:cell shape-determining protein MreC
MLTVRVSQQLENKQQVIGSLRHELTAREELLKAAQHQLQSATSAQVLTGVADPDPDWIRIQSGQWIRIRNPDPGGQNDP